MKTALVTTTINVPRALALCRTDNHDVRFFVAFDKNTPEEAVNFCAHDLPNTQPIYLQDQEKWKCSSLIGWKNIQRRNIAMLEALAWGADVIVSWDDDNLPMQSNYFEEFEANFGGVRYNGIKVSGSNGWFDVGQLLDPIAPHRGFPISKNPPKAGGWRADPAINAKVGVAAGICLGDPDISAVTRIANAPTVHRVSELLRAGIVVDPATWTVFNSQNSALLREIVPAFFLFPGVGRADDIFASLFCQRIMREKGYHVHFGQPFTWQQRNEHDLTRDLINELMGMQQIERLAAYLDAVLLPSDVSVLHSYRYLLEGLDNPPYAILPQHSIEAALAWCDDVEVVMK